jgi:hypothetical protein
MAGGKIMKVLSVSAVEILPAVLDKSKISTMRPAWKILPLSNPVKEGTVTWEIPVEGSTRIKKMIETKPNYKVGETVQLMWKQRTSPRGAMFCRECGEELYPKIKCKKLTGIGGFPKIQGTAEIMEVRRLQMGLIPFTSSGTYYRFWVLYPNGVTRYDEENSTLAGMEGFRGMRYTEDMFEWFSRHYDLIKPKPFWNYIWRWIS